MQLLEAVIFIEMKTFFPKYQKNTWYLLKEMEIFHGTIYRSSTFTGNNLNQIIQSQFISRSETLDRWKKIKGDLMHKTCFWINWGCKPRPSLIEKQLPGLLPSNSSSDSQSGTAGMGRKHKPLQNHLDSNHSLWPCGNHCIPISSFSYFYEEEDVNFL